MQRLLIISIAACLVAGTRAAERLPALLVVEAGAELALTGEELLRLRSHEVFTGRTTEQTSKLGRPVPAGDVVRIHTRLDTRALAPGYHLLTADIERNGASVLGGRVGCDDLYVKRARESMTFTVLSIRTGMVLWVRDLLHGDIMCRTDIALPHVYDPLNRDTYAEFLRVFARTTGKHTEGNEAGDTGLALAAEAFRKSGSMHRCRFAEWLLEDSCEHMIRSMQAPSGGAVTWANELLDDCIGKGPPTQAFGGYDSNQIGEWMRALSYAIVYFRTVPGKRHYAETLSRACRKAGDYLVAHAVQDADGIPHVLRHLRLNEADDGTVRQVAYHQEGRQCDVYLGRALAGLSYYA